METPLFGLLGFGAALALILLRVPVAIAMGVVGIGGYWLLNDWNGVAFILGSAPFESLNRYTLSVVPLFVLMGVFAARAGLSRSLYNGFYALIGHYRGGLALATIGACAGFGAICGSSLATAATMGKVALPEMRRFGYDDRLASASIAAAGTLGVMIPPSVLLVIYAFLTETSVGKLFAAAIIPGILGTLLYMLAVAVQTHINPALGPAGPRMERAEKRHALADMWPVSLLFIVVIGGIYAGFFSPTEAAAFGAFGAFGLALMRKTLNRYVIRDCVIEAASTTGMMFLILIGAGLFNFFIESTQLPQFLVRSVTDMGLGPYGVLLIVLAFYLVLGCLMDSLSMILLTIPVVYPLMVALQFDPIWFGIIVVTVAELGLITPPVGINLFVIQSISVDLKLETIIRGILPFILVDILRLALLVLIPGLALWLPLTMH